MYRPQPIAVSQHNNIIVLMVCQEEKDRRADISSKRRSERDQSVVFFVFLVACLLFLTALLLDVGCLVYARGEVAKCADAAALASASQVEVAGYRDTGRVTFLPGVYAVAQSFAGMNSTYLAGHSIPVTVIQNQIDPTSQVVAVTVAADLSPLLPSLLQGVALVSITGYSQAMIEGR